MEVLQNLINEFENVRSCMWLVQRTVLGVTVIDQNTLPIIKRRQSLSHEKSQECIQYPPSPPRLWSWLLALFQNMTIYNTSVVLL